MPPETFRGPDSSPNCADCPCAVNGRPERPVRGAGSLRSLAIVSDCPSTSDVSQGWPLVSDAGKLLQQVLNANGIDRHSIWITNSILCRKPQTDSALNLAITCCKPRLQHELDLVSPTAILALGGLAAQAMDLPVTAITSARGTVQNSPRDLRTPVITTVHPASILTGGGAGSVSAGKNKMNVDAQYVFLEADTVKAYSLASEPGQPLWSDDIALITQATNNDCAMVLQLCREAKLLAVDLEWGKDGKITWLGISDESRAFSVYLPHMDGMMLAILQDAGESTVPKLFHNLQADVPRWEAQIGPLNGTFEDTMLMHHAAYPGAAHDLQNVTSQFLLVPPWKADRKGEEKQARADERKVISQAKKEAKKAEKQAAHVQRNAASAEAGQARKRQRKLRHDSDNLTAHILKLLGD